MNSFGGVPPERWPGGLYVRQWGKAVVSVGCCARRGTCRHPRTGMRQRPARPSTGRGETSGDGEQRIAGGAWVPPPSGVPGQGEGLPGRIRPLSVKPPPRILLMAASPSDFEPLDGRAEWDKVAGGRSITCGRTASCSRLRQRSSSVSRRPTGAGVLHCRRLCVDVRGNEVRGVWRSRSAAVGVGIDEQRSVVLSHRDPPW